MKNFKAQLSNAVITASQNIDKVRTARNMVMVVMAATAFATPIFAGGLFEDLLTSLKDLFTDVRPVILVLAGIAFVIATAFWLLSKDEKKAGAAFDWMKRIAIGAVVVALAPWLLTQLIGLFGGTLTGGTIDELEQALDGASGGNTQ